MPKNILIFSDGTGQAGGVRPDQRLSNVYKLYRSTRTGPDSAIDPAQQLAFYDAGLGTDDDAGPSLVKFITFLQRLLSSATGRGITRNITDCYEAILNAYEPGDRIYLFGFSRGENKYFSTSAEGAASYARQTVGTGLYQGPYTIVQTSIPTSAIEPIMRTSVDGGGISTVVVPTRILPGLSPGNPLNFTPIQ